MIRTMLWRLDTCTGTPATGCEVLLSYDDTTPLDQRTFEFVSFVNSCRNHVTIPDGQGKFFLVHGENTRKNRAIAAMATVVGEEAAFNAEWKIDDVTRALSFVEPTNLVAIDRLRIRAALASVGANIGFGKPVEGVIL